MALPLTGKLAIVTGASRGMFPYLVYDQLSSADFKRHWPVHYQGPCCPRRKPRPRLHIRQFC